MPTLNRRRRTRHHSPHHNCCWRDLGAEGSFANPPASLPPTALVRPAKDLPMRSEAANLVCPRAKPRLRIHPCDLFRNSALASWLFGALAQVRFWPMTGRNGSAPIATRSGAKPASWKNSPATDRPSYGARASAGVTPVRLSPRDESMLLTGSSPRTRTILRTRSNAA